MPTSRKVSGAQQAVAGMNQINTRKPHFCSGCPHNTSTTLPEGSRALAGIGCHYMATFTPERRTDMHTQMGGEGTPWIGQSPFTDEKHVFVNLGDGTYSHSGSLAIRAAISGKVNATYKILYNDAVAMTGGQQVESGQTVPQIARQVEAEGVKTIVIVADDHDALCVGDATCRKARASSTARSWKKCRSSCARRRACPC